MTQRRITDRQWAFIHPLHTASSSHRQSARRRSPDHRGILYVLITGCCWQDLPREFGAPTTVWRRLKQWGGVGVWERIWRAALAALEVHG